MVRVVNQKMKEKGSDQMKSLLVKLGVILVGLAIFGYAAVCKAQCAWVLWEFQITGGVEGSGGWMINSAFPNYELCMKQLNKSLTYAENSFKKTPNARVNLVVNGVIATVMEEGGKEKLLWQFLYRCLPDTIDPRK